MATVRNNIAFLDRYVGNGWTVAGFCRTLPYAGTPLKRRFAAEGRLLGTPFEPDYHFLDPKLDLFYNWMLRTFQERNFSNRGLCAVLRSLLFDAHLSLPSHRKFAPSERAQLHSITAQCNGHALYCLGSALDYVEATPVEKIDFREGYLAKLTAHELAQERRLMTQVASLYLSTRAPRGASAADLEQFRGPGAFENSWTLAPRDMPVAN